MTADGESSQTPLRPAVPDTPTVTVTPEAPLDPTPPPAPSGWLRRGTAGAGRGLSGARRAFAGWTRRPSGQFALSAVAVLALLGLSGSAGAYLVPAAAPKPSAPTGGPAQISAKVPDQPGGGGLAGTPAPGRSGVDAQVGGQSPAGRPADSLGDWARKIGGPLDIPTVAMQAYGYAQLVVAQTQPNCRLRWTTLAGIGKIESDHGRARGASLQPDGHALPPIIGPALDGTHDNQLIRDTDSGRLDGDRTYDHAVGPMQFLPGTWQLYQVDADGDGTADPNDINDAALAAANYLCSGGRDLSTPAGWWPAILSYNAIQQYAQDVFAAADDYGRRSRSVT